MDRPQGWIVTIAGDRSVDDVAEDINAAGFVVDQVLDAIGVITGSASESVAQSVRALPGVADVSAEQAIDIGPPGQPTTW